jgi:methionyl-tRNA formyltransferase
MKAVIVTQEEPFYIPIFLGKLLAEYKGIIAVIILPGIPKGFTIVSYGRRMYEVFGLKDFVAYGTLFIYYRFLNFLSHWAQFKRLYSVRAAAKKNSIPVYKLGSINSPESLNLLKSLKTEVIVSVASPQIFKKEIINLVNHSINIHAALLPQYRGMMPSFWVLAKGEVKTGITVHCMNHNIDTGNIILQKEIQLSPEDTLHSLQNKVACEGAVALLEVLERIEKSGDIDDIVVSLEEEKGSYYSFPTKEAAKEFRARGRRFI